MKKINSIEQNKEDLNHYAKRMLFNSSIFIPGLLSSFFSGGESGEHSILLNICVGFFIYIGAVLRTVANSVKLINNEREFDIDLYNIMFGFEFLITSFLWYLYSPQHIFELLGFNIVYFICSFLFDNEFPGNGILVTLLTLPFLVFDIKSPILKFLKYSSLFTPVFFYTDFIKNALGNQTLLYAAIATVLGSIYRLFISDKKLRDFNYVMELLKHQDSNFISWDNEKFFKENVIPEILYLTVILGVIFLQYNSYI